MVNNFESFAEKIRNFLTPYANLIRMVEMFADGQLTETQFKSSFQKFRQNYKDNLDNFIELSKRDELENIPY